LNDSIQRLFIDGFVGAICGRAVKGRKRCNKQRKIRIVRFPDNCFIVPVQIHAGNTHPSDLDEEVFINGKK
jgi:hypothetical protein